MKGMSSTRISRRTLKSDNWHRLVGEKSPFHSLTPPRQPSETVVGLTYTFRSPLHECDRRLRPRAPAVCGPYGLGPVLFFGPQIRSMFRLVPSLVVCVAFSSFNIVGEQQAPAKSAPIALRDRVPSNDPLAGHDLRFDASFAHQALAYLRSDDPILLESMSESPAITHILDHARNFDYDVPKESRTALVSSLLGPPNEQARRAAICEQSIAYFSGPMLSDPHWVNDALTYLPADFRYRGTLFLTFGYDIGVAFASNASLNCTHSHFDGHPRELLYYAIHELHHVGFMLYQTPPRLADMKSCGDLLNLINYSTQLEGMAVLAANQRRREDHALADDADYVALEDGKRMQADLVSYFKDYDYLKKRRSEPADAEAWAVIHRMSSGERLWYRVGAYMAQRIEASKGRAILTALVKQGPAQFMASYESLPSQAVH
jgi:hypothetical protein